jgi:hypothetical protein
VTVKIRQRDIMPGMTFGSATVIGPADPEWRGAKNSWRYLVVECWACRGRRDVYANNLIRGKAENCKPCSRDRARMRRAFWHNTRPTHTRRGHDGRFAKERVMP